MHKLNISRGVLALLFAVLALGCDPRTNESNGLLDGGVIRGDVDDECADGIVQDALNLLCTFIPGTSCTDRSSSCNRYSRQIFTGTTFEAS